MTTQGVLRHRSKVMVRLAYNRLKGLSKLYRRGRKLWVKQTSRLSSVLRRRLEIAWHKRRPPLIFIRPSKQLSHPDFIILGAPKCGTSWLQRALSQHPSVVIVPDEIEYFSYHLEYPLRWYLEHFKRQMKATPPSPGVPFVIGEKSARYCSIGLDHIRIMHSLLADARLILLVRDPVVRHWSHAKVHFSKRRHNPAEGGITAISRNELFHFFGRMRPLGEFSTMIANWTKIYRPEQLLIVSQEKTLERPRDTFDAVLNHIGATTDYDPGSIKALRQQINSGPKLPMPDDVRAHLETMFSAERDRLHSLIGDNAAVSAAAVFGRAA